MTLAIAGQWEYFGSDSGLYRYAQRHLREPADFFEALDDTAAPTRDIGWWPPVRSTS